MEFEIAVSFSKVLFHCLQSYVRMCSILHLEANEIYIIMWNKSVYG